jgi:hypothetical protein
VGDEAAPRAHRKFGTGVNTWPLSLRIALTAVPAVWLFVLVASLVLLIASDEDKRPAAMLVFLITISVAVLWPLLRELWRPSTEWSLDRRAELRAEMDRIDQARDPVVRDELRPFGED